MNIQGLTGLVRAQNQDILQTKPRVIVSLSGGVDSTALFHVLLKLSKQKKIFLDQAIHFNFGLRGHESVDDQRYLELICEKANLPLKTYFPRSKGRPKGENIQNWARKLRQDVYSSYAQEGVLIALGHNRDDLAENVLFRLIRGYQPENLAGMSRLDGSIWRPLLDIPKSDLVKCLKTSKLTWREDSSNESLKYSRNLIRLKVMPLLESINAGAGGRIADLGLKLSLTGHQTKGFLNQTTTKSTDSFRVLASQYSSALDGIDFGFIFQKKDRLTAWNTVQRSIKGAKKSVILDLQASGSVFVRKPTSRTKVKIAGVASPLMFKEVMQKWKIRLEERGNFFVLCNEVDTHPILALVVNDKMEFATHPKSTDRDE